MNGISFKKPALCEVCKKKPAKMRSHYKGLKGWTCKECHAKTEALKAKQAAEK